MVLRMAHLEVELSCLAVAPLGSRSKKQAHPEPFCACAPGYLSPYRFFSLPPCGVCLLCGYRWFIL